MDNALLSKNILARVFKHLAPGPKLDNSESDVRKAQRAACQKTLACAARVCHAFNGPALDALWSTVDDITVLLSVLPTFRKKPGYEGSYFFVKSPTDKEWACFQRYAARVRELHYKDADSLDPSVWTILSRRCSDNALLPNLESLNQCVVDDLFPSRSILLTLTLRRLVLTISRYGWLDIVEQAVEDVQPFLEGVEDLVISQREGEWKEKQLVKFWTLTHLRTLEVTHKVKMTSEIVRPLTTFPGLRSLSLHFDLGAGMRRDDNSPLAFSSLRHLKLRSSIADIAKFSGTISFPNLESFSVEVDDVGTTSEREFQVHFRNMFSHLPPTLRRVHFSALPNRDVDDNNPHYYRQSYSTNLPNIKYFLEPLRPVNGLQEIVISCRHHSVKVTETLMHSMEEAWPELVKLEMELKKCPPASVAVEDGTYIPYPIRPSRGRSPSILGIDEPSSPPSVPVQRESTALPTVHALIAFVRAHPKLEHLTLPSLSVPSSLDMLSIPLLDHDLRHLRIQVIEPRKATLGVALALDRAFPNLGGTIASSDVNQTFYDEGDLELLLTALQLGRRGIHQTSSSVASS